MSYSLLTPAGASQPEHRNQGRFVHTMDKLNNKNNQDRRAGFTLVELLIVVIILGILAAIVVPKLSVVSDDANLSALESDLLIVRNAIQRYHIQHNNTFPGANRNNGTPGGNAVDACSDFMHQLTRYTNQTGGFKNKKIGAFVHGPYLRQEELPANPFNNLSGLVCDITTEDINARVSDGTSGWKFYIKTGVFIANDGAHDSL